MQPQDILPHVFRHLRRRDIVQCSYVSRRWHSAAACFLYERPVFGDSQRSVFAAFSLFLECLASHLPLQTRRHIRIIDLSGIGESLYETVDQRWFTILFTSCPGLECLVLRQATFLTAEAVDHYTSISSQEMPSLRVLDLSGCHNLSQHAARKLIELCPGLTRLTLDGCTELSDQTLAKLADWCSELRILSLQRCVHITDAGILALAKFGRNHVEELDLTGLSRLTDHGLSSLVRFCPRLRRLVLRECPWITAERGFPALVYSVGQMLETLDLSYCPRLRMNHVHLQELQRYAHFRRLDLSASALPALADDEGLALIADALSSLPALETLGLHQVPEELPANVLVVLASISAPQFREVIVHREAFTCDYMLGWYADLADPSLAQKRLADVARTPLTRWLPSTRALVRFVPEPLSEG